MEHSSKALRRLNHLLSETDAAYHEASVRLGLSDSVMQILYTVCNYGDGRRCPLQEVCVQTGVSKQTINSALRKLEAEGAVYLEQAGRKGKDVCLTPRGEALAGRTAARIIQMENHIFASWPEDEVTAYLTLMEKYLASFRAELERQIKGPRHPERTEK